MVKLGHFSLAIVLGVIVSLSLFTEGAFAQNVSPGKTNQATGVVGTTTILQGVNQTIQVSSAHPQLPHQWKKSVSWQIVCARFYRPVRVYQNGRWVTVCRRY